jgi:hypothetical protein
MPFSAFLLFSLRPSSHLYSLLLQNVESRTAPPSVDLAQHQLDFKDVTERFTSSIQELKEIQHAALVSRTPAALEQAYQATLQHPSNQLLRLEKRYSSFFFFLLLMFCSPLPSFQPCFLLFFTPDSLPPTIFLALVSSPLFLL